MPRNRSNGGTQVTRTSYIDSLPREVLLLIFEELDDSSIRKCAAVCSKWRTLINSSGEFWKHRYELKKLPTPPTVYQWKEALLYNQNPNEYLSRHQTAVQKKMFNYHMQIFILYVLMLPILLTYVELFFFLKSIVLILPFLFVTLLTRRKISKLTAFPNGSLSYIFDKKTLQTNLKFPLRDRLIKCLFSCALIPLYTSITSLLYLASGDSGVWNIAFTILYLPRTLVQWSRNSNGRFDKYENAFSFKRIIFGGLVIILYWMMPVPVHRTMGALITCFSLFTLDLIGQWKFMKQFHAHSPEHTPYRSLFVFGLAMFPVALVGPTFVEIPKLVGKHLIRITLVSIVCGLLRSVNPHIHSQFLLCCVACSVLNAWTCYSVCLYELWLCGTLRFTNDYSEPANNWDILTSASAAKKSTRLYGNFRDYWKSPKLKKD